MQTMSVRRSSKKIFNTVIISNTKYDTCEKSCNDD
jgi:hypothetical protein